MSADIEARLHQAYDGFTLSVDLRLPARGVSAIFGPSGCGKTTLLRCIAGLQRAGEARLLVAGATWQDEARGVFVPPHQRSIGYVFQEANLFPHLDVRRNLEFGMRRVAPAARRVTWDQALGLLGIGHLLERLPAHLSGGERQRVGIARALLCSPRLLLMDEPLASLEAARKKEILPYLERLHRELDIPVLYISHAPDEVARLADHLVVMEAGRVLASGPLGQILARLDLPIRLGDEAGVVLEGTLAERDERWHLARVDVGAGSLWVRDAGLAPGATARVRILARDVSIARQTPTASSISNVLAATIEEFGDDEHPALLLLRLRAGRHAVLARLTRRSAQELDLAPGLAVHLQIKAVALL
jgi:molybdate transport system ATP-binding protein